jgi:hypothetical protein
MPTACRLLPVANLASYSLQQFLKQVNDCMIPARLDYTPDPGVTNRQEILTPLGNLHKDEPRQRRGSSLFCS